ncbi:DUF1471 domain-containing protein [Leclercia adecarboxylata]|nr:DUF1471 domain-containing protein [Leclercia adecarboxylata]
MFAGKKSAQIREILISESAWEEMTCLFAPSLVVGVAYFRFSLKADLPFSPAFCFEPLSAVSRSPFHTSNQSRSDFAKKPNSPLNRGRAGTGISGCLRLKT